MSIRIPSDSVTTGENAEHPTYSDHAYVKCGNCGFICNTDRDLRGRDGSRAGDGYNRIYTQLASAVSVADTTITVDSASSFISPDTGSITVFADPGQRWNKTTVTSASHGLSDEDLIIISVTTNYNGTFKITDVGDDTFSIFKTFTADDATGTWIKIERATLWTADGDKAMTFKYTGTGATTFTGCTNVVGAFAIDDYVRQDSVTAGCPLCGTLRYEEI